MSRLRERIDAELEQIDQNLRHLPGSDELPNKSELEVAGVVALINSLYNGVESILKQVLLARSLPLPAGEAWHMALLAAAKDQAIMTVPLFEKLKTYMAFRHFFHMHMCSISIQPALSRRFAIYRM